MAKRISLSERRAADAPRGVDVLFNNPDSAVESDTRESSTSENVPTPIKNETQIVTASTKVSEALNPAKTTDGVQSAANASEKPVLAKATVYIRPDQVLAIESIQLSLRQKTGQKPDKSELFQEAVDLLTAKYRV